MKMRKLLHIVAVVLSSLASLVPHAAKAQDPTSDSTTSAKKKKEVRHHRDGNGGSKASDLASQDPPVRKHHLTSSGGDIKNSSHAATWSSYSQQNGETPVAPKLDPALMASAESSIVPPPMHADSAPALLAGDQQSRYPWKRQIVTTTFWVGESATRNNPVPNRSSCWDDNWARHYGGSDPSEKSARTADYIPASFKPGQNPFYVALPYNDMEHGAHKAEATQIIPWFSKDYKGPGKSVCEGRWIAIRFGSKVCYAQWEDAGPFRTDHWQYVFGNERPKPNLNGGAGLDVSPAVRDYLGMNGTDVTDWKFVDFNEVPTGPWAKYGENNTFVQNARKPDSQVAENVSDIGPRSYGGAIPGMSTNAVELR